MQTQTKQHKVTLILLYCITFSQSYAGGFAGGDPSIKNEPAPGLSDKSAKGAVEAFTGVDFNQSDFMKASKLRVGGAVVAGITYTPASPTDRSTFPVTFNDRSNEFQFNRFRLFLQRDVQETGSTWDIGGRFDFVTGADARYSTSKGLDDKFLLENRFSRIALPQFYLHVYAPYGRGVTTQIGHFFTPIGSTSPFYSVSYTANSEPSSHTGVLFSTPVTDNLTLAAGAILGTEDTFDNFDKNLDVWNFLGSVTWSYYTTKLAASLVTGDDTSYADINGSGKRQANRTHASFVLNQDFTRKWHYKFQHDVGYQSVAFNAQPAHWYGIEQAVLYDISPQLSAGFRADWFKDQNGLKVMIDGLPATYYSVTAGLFWKPLKWFTLRPELRYDVTNNPVFNDLTDRQQFTFATSFLIKL